MAMRSIERMGNFPRRSLRRCCRDRRSASPVCMAPGLRGSLMGGVLTSKDPTHGKRSELALVSGPAVLAERIADRSVVAIATVRQRFVFRRRLPGTSRGHDGGALIAERTRVWSWHL